MSKNFELLQQAKREREIVRFPELKTISPTGSGNGYGRTNGRRNRASLNLDQLVREEFLRLAQRVFLLKTEKPPHSVVFAGVDHGNGCSRICAGAAEILASNTTRSVCLVDANLRSPSLAQLFGLTNNQGLTDALLKEGLIRGFVRQLEPKNLWLLSCGSLVPDSHGLLNSESLRTRLAALHEEFDHVLIDAPPLNTYADAISLGQLTDGLVLILEANSTRRESALKVIENLRAAQVHLLGAVLNKRTFPIPEFLYHKL